MRVLRGLTALLVLGLGLVGAPWFLTSYVGNPLADLDGPTGRGLRHWVTALTRPDDGTLLIGLVVGVAWAAWLVFAISVLSEIAALVSRYRFRPQLPGLAAPQRLASSLLLAVVALVLLFAPAGRAGPARAAPTGSSGPVDNLSPADRRGPIDQLGDAAQASGAEPVERSSGNHRVSDPGATPGSATPGTGPNRIPAAAPSGVAGKQSASEASYQTYVVRAGDDLWTLAERFYGNGRQWRRIAAANPGRLSDGPDRLLPGWKLQIPPATDRPNTGKTSYLVRSGDSLSSIARRAYGDPGRWPEIFEANRHQLRDPDQLPVGVRLVIPTEPAAGAGGSSRQHQQIHTPASRPAAPPAARPRVDHRNSGSEDRPAAPIPKVEVTQTPLATPVAVSPAPVPAPAGPPPSQSPTLEDRPQVQPSIGAALALPEPADARSVSEIAMGAAATSGLLAAAIVAITRRRRRRQLMSRPVGRRIHQPSARAQLAETHLGIRQQPLSLRTLDLAIRSIGAFSRRTGTTLPVLVTGTVREDHLLLAMTEPGLVGPSAFQVVGTSWRLDAVDVDQIRSTPGLSTAVRPYPALITLGTSREQACQPTTEPGLIVADLEALRLTNISGDDQSLVGAVLAAITFELACSPWIAELEVELFGACPGLESAVAEGQVRQCDDLEPLIEQLELRSTAQRTQLSSLDDNPKASGHSAQSASPESQPDQLAGSAAAARIEPDRAEAWTPTILVINQEVPDRLRQRLLDLVLAEPAASVAVIGVGLGSAGSQLVVTGDRQHPIARLEPAGLEITPQLLEPPVAAAVVELLQATGSTETTPAPWWCHTDPESAADSSSGRTHGGTDAEEVTDPAAPVSVPAVRAGRRWDGGWVDHGAEAGGATAAGRRAVIAGGSSPPLSGDPPDQFGLSTVSDHRHLDQHDNQHDDGINIRPEGEEAVVMDRRPNRIPSSAEHHPTLLLLGPVELSGAAGPVPPRAAKQCLEYCAWILERPGAGASEMTAGLAVAEGTRRSNMSRLRTWLGADEFGQPYLPDAYSGRIHLHPAVSSDWQQVQILIGRGTNLTSTRGLEATLNLVRGAPFADAAPGQWHWAEGVRTDMISIIRDIGVELTERALRTGDLDLARWAAARALAVAPGDELLLVARIKTEYRAGHGAEVERLTLQLAAQARALEHDLLPETVDVLQEMMEGRVRARMI